MLYMERGADIIVHYPIQGIGYFLLHYPILGSHVMV